MRWPWTAWPSTAQTATKQEDRDDGPVVEESPRPMGWAFSPPLTGVISEPPTVLQATRFATTLPAWSSPRFLGELSHLSSAEAPSALVGDLVPGRPHESAPVVDLSLRARALAAPMRPAMRAIGDVPRSEPTLVRGASGGDPGRSVPVQRLVDAGAVQGTAVPESLVQESAVVAGPQAISELLDDSAADEQRPLLGAERTADADAAPAPAPVQRDAVETPRRLGLGAPLSPIAGVVPVASFPHEVAAPTAHVLQDLPLPAFPGESRLAPTGTRGGPSEALGTVDIVPETASETEKEVPSASAELLHEAERPAELVLALQRSHESIDAELPTRELLGVHPLTVPAAAGVRPAASAVVGARVLAPAAPPLPRNLQRETTSPTGARSVSVSRIPFTPSMPAVPAMPAVPSIPTLPSMPTMPSLPSTADLPSMPSAPSIPGMPTLGSLPSAGAIPRMGSGPGMPSLPLAPSAAGLAEAARASAGSAARSLTGRAEGLVSSGESAIDGARSSATEAVDAARDVGGSAAHGAHEAASAAGGAAAAGGGAAAALGGAAASLSPEALDKLVAKIAPPLLRRLKSELIQDRERRGLRTDARAGGGA